jgi:hypothetical protein
MIGMPHVWHDIKPNLFRQARNARAPNRLSVLPFEMREKSGVDRICLMSGGQELDYGASETRVQSEASEQSCICAGNRRGLFGGIEQRLARGCVGDG